MPKLVEEFPPIKDARIISAPIVSVLILEDRAQIKRRVSIALEPSPSLRLAIKDVAPVLRDVSVLARSESEGLRIVDVRAERALRVKRSERSKEAVALEDQARALLKRFERLERERARTETNVERLLEILEGGLQEIPEEAAWGMGDAAHWSKVFEDLFSRWRALLQKDAQHFDEELSITHEYDDLRAQYLSDVTSERKIVCWLELNAEVSKAGTHTFDIEYTVPNAMWRPMHHARLVDDTLELRSSGVVWQNTGEDWTDVDCLFSTARASLGTEAPALRPDFLSAQKRKEQVEIEMREVKVQRAKGGQSAPKQTIELPGVDDGGQVQNLKSSHKVSVLSNGRAHTIEYARFKTRAKETLVCTPEIDLAVHRKIDAVNIAKSPLLAGPVELSEGSGRVGFSELMFVASEESFSLGYGPDDALRVVREDEHESEVDAVSKETHKTVLIKTYLSNTSGKPKTLLLRERIPRSEVEHAKVVVLEDEAKTTSLPSVCENGFCDWTLTLEANSHQARSFGWQLRLAPGSALR